MSDPKRDQQDAQQQTPIRPDGNVASGDRQDETTGGEDSSPFEAVPSGERADAAQEPQNAPAGS